MDPSCYETEIYREDFVNWCIEDREFLTREFFILRPHHEGRAPAFWIDELLEVLGYRVHYLPMAPEQFGLCDMGNRLVSINSQLDVIAQRITAAHELGHVRLHERELEQGGNDEDYELVRKRQRENEADLYSAIFLVSRDELLKQEDLLDLLESRYSKTQKPSEEIWLVVENLADGFGVSPEFMLSCLVDLNWLEISQTNWHSDKELRVKRPMAW